MEGNPSTEFPMIRRIFFVLIPLLALSSCFFPFGIVTGNGTVVRETRDVTGMTALYHEGAMEVTVQVGDRDSCVLEMEENLLPYIETYLNGDALVIRTQLGSSIASTRPMRATVTMRRLNVATLAGSGTLDIAGIQSADLSLSLTGSGSLTARGSAGTISACITGSGSMQMTGFTASNVEGYLTGSGSLTLAGSAYSVHGTITGSGNLEAAGLTTTDAELTLSGSGNATLGVQRALKGSILGSGSIYYSGSPTVSVSRLGSGTVIKR